MFNSISNLHFKIISFILLILSLSNVTNAERRLYSNSLVNCMKNNSDIIPNYFNVVFDAEKRSINYDISLTAKIQGKLKAFATVYAFGFDIIHETVDLCNLNLKQFCPITPSHMEVESIEYISQDYVDKIPGIAYTFPNLDAVARLVITDENNGLLGCLQASFDNGKNVSHEGAKWATAVVAGLGLLISALLSIFGNSASASRMSAAAISLFTYFQSVVIIAMVSADQVPMIANSWAENLAWSMGLIRIEFMQKIFRWFVQATGGTPTQFLTSGVKSILTQRSIDYISHSNFVSKIGSLFGLSSSSLSSSSSSSSYSYDYGYDDDFDFNIDSIINTKSINPRSDADQDTKWFIPMTHVESNDYLTVLRGIKRIGFDSNIEPSSIVCTGFTFFILCLYVLIGVFFIYRYLNKTLSKGQKANWINKNIEYRTDWRPTFKGMLARYIFIGYPQLLILSLYEFTQVDSGAVVTIAVFFLILTLSTLGFACFQVIRYGKKSIDEHGNPAALLYGNPEILSRYGFLYTMLNATKYWFCAVSLSYIFIKSFFVGLAQSSGRTQAMALWILDMFYLGLMCHYLPYMDKFTNVLSIFIQVITTINSFFFTFFSGIYNEPFRVASVMGLVFFIMNAAVSLILLIVILLLAAFTIFSKNPDAKFSPTKDDRTSFQRKHQSLNTDNVSSNELFELGMVARDHNDNWENDMHNQKMEADSPELKNSETNLFTNNDLNNSSDSETQKGGITGFLSRGKSLLSRNKSFKNNNNEVEPISSNINNNDNQINADRDSLDSSVIGDTTKDPFKTHEENPFESDSVQIPFSHNRNESHLSGLTNNTAGLSVYGERINSTDFTNIHPSSPVQEEHFYNDHHNNNYDDDEYYDDNSLHAQRRL